MPAITHPVCASLDHPLRLRRKEGFKVGQPSFPLAEERVDEQSDVGVSNRRHTKKILFLQTIS
ncbi:MAG: hypothetical protein JWP71_3208 [Mucilaginibacter sp.]|nr:hypothetical protein [Mucilaginibacter sp.]